MRRRLLALGIAAAGLGLVGPASGASAQVAPGVPAVPGVPYAPLGGGSAIGGNQIGSAGCVGTNRPSFGGNNGSTSAQTCGAVLAFTGPQIGQISSVIGPTMIGSPFSEVTVSAGPITQVSP
jgi:hypothetical protein